MTIHNRIEIMTSRTAATSRASSTTDDPPPRPCPPCTGHLAMVGQVPQYPVGVGTPRIPLSAVVVPTARPADHAGGGLALAAQVAQAWGARLVVLRSGPASRAPFPRHLLPRGVEAAVIDLPASAQDLIPSWRSNEQVISTLHRGGDLGFKRNLALMIGLICGWQSIALMDDDITARRASRLTAPTGPGDFLRLGDVLADFAQCPHLQVAGYLQKDFDDNSVVCHARRLVGLSQEGFVSGGAMVVRCGPELPFFPSVYNEDWLFMFSLILDGLHVMP